MDIEDKLTVFIILEKIGFSSISHNSELNSSRMNIVFVIYQKQQLKFEILLYKQLKKQNILMTKYLMIDYQELILFKERFSKVKYLG